MTARVLYNEHDPHAAAWLRRLIAAGHLPPGVVDSRSILALRPRDLDGFTSFHTFAGIGGWPYALRLAGWLDDLEVWTGSCPCQPFSVAGSRRGLEDERHLWPAFFRLIEERRPHVVFGEQVASKDGLAWLDLVQADLEGAGYAFGAVDLCAAGVGAPHRRQRLYWVGYADGGPTREHAGELPGHEGAHGERTADGGDGAQRPGGTRGLAGDHQARRLIECAARLHGRRQRGDDASRRGPMRPWDDPDWVFCDDPGGPRWRPVEPGSFPLVDGAPERLGRLRGYGNALVPQLAAEFVLAALEALQELDSPPPSPSLAPTLPDPASTR